MLRLVPYVLRWGALFGPLVDGQVAEWLKASVSKIDVGPVSTAGSNPALPAISLLLFIKRIRQLMPFWVFCVDSATLPSLLGDIASLSTTCFALGRAYSLCVFAFGLTTYSRHSCFYAGIV